MLCAAAGIHPEDFDRNDMRTNYILLEGYQQREQSEWERTRAICYNVARFGQSNPKKFPKTPQAFWPLPWDEKHKETTSEDPRQVWLENRKRIEEAMAKKPYVPSAARKLSEVVPVTENNKN